MDGLQVGKADIEARDDEGMSALLRACAKGHVAAIQGLYSMHLK